MTNNLENKEVLSDQILNAIDLIIKHTPNAVFGGSIALNAVGLINRKVSDIDLFFHLNESLTKNGFLSIENDGQILSDTVTNVNGVEIQRTGAKIAGVKACCFKVSDEEMQHSKIEFLGRKICVQNVNYAIMAKMTYADKNDKHKEDLKQIINDCVDYELPGITAKTDIQKDLKFDSLDVVELLIDLEKQYQISISDEEFEKVRTFQELCDLMQSILTTPELLNN